MSRSTRSAPGQLMYHCHVLEHEDECMVRPFVVLAPEVMAVDPHTGGASHDHDASS